MPVNIRSRLLEENGPCLVGPDSKTTYLNPWSWNNEVNMLYVDQPTQVGFSYDVPTNGTMELGVEDFGEAVFYTIPRNFTEVPEANLTTRVGTFSSQKLASTANSTSFAAHALWHFAQTWFLEFPYYKPTDNRISLWAESYGGHYGPGIFKFFQEQNERIANDNSTEGDAHYLHLDTLGIVDGLIDLVIAGEAWINYGFNNTYGIQVFNQSIYDELTTNWTKPDGCKEETTACQKALKKRDSLNPPEGNNWKEVCSPLFESCSYSIVGLYNSLDHGWFDIGHPGADPFPAPYMYGYLTEESVLSALGVPVNYSEHSEAVGTGFRNSFDMMHGGFLDAIGYLLDSGIKVHMMYGDRDFACNWVGGEASSLAIPYSRANEFANAGYAPLVTSNGINGMTRQLGNFSFTRVFQAGHEVPSYQPEAAYEIFNRATSNRDVPTGLLPASDDFVTIGPKTVWHIKNDPPTRPEPRCNVLKPGSCTFEMLEKIKAGKVLVEDWFVVGEVADDDVGAFTSPKDGGIGQVPIGEL